MTAVPPDALLSLVIGGARCGKSRHAEALTLAAAARAGRGKPVYLATFRPWGDDPEMDERLHRHQQRRGDAWDLEEVPVALDAALRRHDARPVLVDCLTLWLSNLLLDEADIPAHTVLLIRALRDRSAPTVLVANEVGLGIVPETPLGRRFRDEAGSLNQRIAACCHHVTLMTAGLPLTLKGAPGG